MKLGDKINNSVDRIQKSIELLSNEEAIDIFNIVNQLNAKMRVILKFENEVDEKLNELNQKLDEFEKRK